MVAAKAKSTEVYGLVSKDLGEVGNQVGSAAGSVGQQVGSAAGAVKKTLEVRKGTSQCEIRFQTYRGIYYLRIITAVVENNLSFSLSSSSLNCPFSLHKYDASLIGITLLAVRTPFRPTSTPEIQTGCMFQRFIMRSISMTLMTATMR